MNDLCGLLMRFRLNHIAMVADIEKAFIQIGLQPDQRDVTILFWMKDSSQTRLDHDSIQEYRFLSCALSLNTYVLISCVSYMRVFCLLKGAMIMFYKKKVIIQKRKHMICFVWPKC